MGKSLKIILHISFWIGIVLWRAKGDYYHGICIDYFILHNLLRVPPIIISTYLLSYYFLPKYLMKEKNYKRFILFFLINFFFAVYAERFIITSPLMSYFLPLDSPAIKWFADLHPFRNSFAILSLMGIFSFIQFFKLHLEEEKKRNLLQEENLKTKLDFLKAQVNPHFLFNALNNIYSMAIQKDQQDIAAGLDNLSGIMKYLTYESNMEKVPLKKEILLLKNYIEIQHLRIDETDDVTISFNIDGDLEGQEIAPVVLLPLIENGFKHGIKLNEVCLVSISLLLKDNHLNFKMKNSLFETEEKSAIEKGIGIENVRRRLDLLYPDYYELSLLEEQHYFITELNLDLNGGQET